MLTLIITFTILSVWIGEKTHLPYPVLLLLMAVVLACIPQVPNFTMDPEIILPIFLPPMVFAVARKASWSIFVRHWRTLLVMSLGLTVATAVVIAGVSVWLVPGIGVPLAFVLGAIVAPNDPVALEVVAEPAKIPRGLMRTLQTESLFNDAVAIVIFATAVTAAHGGGSFGGIIASLVLSAVGSGLLGYLLGWVISFANHQVHSVAATGGVSIIAPFAAYIGAETIGASGVIATVVVALEINRREAADAYQDRLMTASFWEVVELIVNGLAFGLMGFEMRGVVEDEGWENVLSYLGIAAVIVVALFLVRVVFTWIMYLIQKRAGRGESPKDWRDCAAVNWCGMRALTTLALALSLPAWVQGSPLEYRGLIVVTSLVVVFVTLVPMGLALPALVRKLKLTEDQTALQEERKELVGRAMKSSHVALEHYLDNTDMPEYQREELMAWFERLMFRLKNDNKDAAVLDKAGNFHRYGSGGASHSEVHDVSIRNSADMRDLLIGAQAVALEAAREEMLRARSDTSVDVATVEQILRGLDLRTAAMITRQRPHKSFGARSKTSGSAALAHRRGRINPVTRIAKTVRNNTRLGKPGPSEGGD